MTAVQCRTSLNRTLLDQHQTELLDRVEKSRQLVQGFLQDELQQDVPTGNSANLTLNFTMQLE